MPAWNSSSGCKLTLIKSFTPTLLGGVDNWMGDHLSKPRHGEPGRQLFHLYACWIRSGFNQNNWFLSHSVLTESRGTESLYFAPLELFPIHINSRLGVRNLCSLPNMAAAWQNSRNDKTEKVAYMTMGVVVILVQTTKTTTTHHVPFLR